MCFLTVSVQISVQKRDIIIQGKYYLLWVVCLALVAKNTNSLLFISPIILEETILDAPLFSGLLEILQKTVARSPWETSLSILLFSWAAQSSDNVGLFVFFHLFYPFCEQKIWLHLAMDLCSGSIFSRSMISDSITSTSLSVSNTWFFRPLNYAVNESLLFSNKGKISFNLCRLAWKVSRKGLGKSFLPWVWQFGEAWYDS